MTPEEIAAIIEDHKFPTLRAGETGIHVITLQIWLQMLGFYQGAITGLLDAATAQAVDGFRAQQRAAGIALQAPAGAVLVRDTWESMEHLLQQRLPPDPSTLARMPFPRRSAYDSEARYQKALYEGLRAFGFPVQPAEQPLRLPVVINVSGVGILHGIPPGSYTLEPGDTTSPGRGSAEIHLEDADGTPLSGQIRLVRDGAEQSATVAGGHALVNDLEPGTYQITVETVDEARLGEASTGSLEVRLVDPDHRPSGGIATLVGETGDVASLRQAIRLFQALVRKVNRGLEPGDRSGLDRNILTGELAETAHGHHERAWDGFEHTWGRFYGAPWMGVMFHPLDDAEELNWGERGTVAMLYEWGHAYLQGSRDEEDLAERLRRPVAIRYMARALGGRIDQRNDFSQIGTQTSLHLPRKSEKIIDGIPTGQMYGDIDYDSPEYSAIHLKAQLAAFASAPPGFCAQCPDDVLAPTLLPAELWPFEARLAVDRYTRNRSINGSARRIWRTLRSPFSADEKAQFQKACRPFLSAEELEWSSRADEAFYNKDQIKRILEHLAQGPLATDFRTLVVLTHIKEIQKALWHCRLLLRTGWREQAKALSRKFLDRGYKGLFADYEDPANEDIARLAFTFNDEDWENPWQLEALVEFYVNYNDPWLPLTQVIGGQNKPRSPGEQGFIEAVREQMPRGLHFVLVDPMGPRLAGTGSSVAGTNATDVEVQLTNAGQPEDFKRVNELLDTIHFPDVDANSRKTYRIKKKRFDPKALTAGMIVTLDRRTDEDVPRITGRWQIPAGIGGAGVQRYIMNDTKSGCDNYDGVLFVMKDGLIKGRYQYSSFTSHRNLERASLFAPMSIRGNRSYDFFSSRAVGSAFINYAFYVKTPPQQGGADGARYYYANPVVNNPGRPAGNIRPRDRTKTKENPMGTWPMGTWDVFIHHGRSSVASNGSEGCLVSPQFYALRDCVLGLFSNETSSAWTKIRETLLGKGHSASETAWSRDAISWDNKIQGTLWVVRPDERPLG